MKRIADGTGLEGEPTARAFVLAALRAVLGSQGGMTNRWQEPLGEAEAQAVLQISKRNKIGGLVKSGIDRAGFLVDAPLREALGKQQAETIAKNLQNLVETEKVALLFCGAQIEALVLKGPVRSYQVFGTFDARASNDIDLLVRPASYHRAGRVLLESGYRSGVRANDRWWHECLGESPYVPLTGRCIVDIHHKVQQPGGPYPADLELFFAEAEVLEVANRTFRMPGRWGALLLSYISVSKALRNAEPWLGHAAEIASCKIRMSKCDAQAFRKLAERQSLSRMIEQIDRVVDHIFAHDPSAADTGGTSLDQLAATAFYGINEHHRALHRSRLVWQWSEGSGIRRSWHFARMSCDRLAADYHRLRGGAAAIRLSNSA